MSYIIISVCAVMILIISISSEIRIKKKNHMIATLTEHINNMEEESERFADKFEGYVALLVKMQNGYEKLSAYSTTLLNVLNKQFGEEEAERLIVDSLVTEQATDINQLFKDLVNDFENDKNSDYTDHESEEETDAR